MDEVAFFILGVLPYWYTLALPEKRRSYWVVLIWCCLVWIAYFWHHGRTAPLVNNIVELGLATYGLRRSQKVASPA